MDIFGIVKSYFGVVEDGEKIALPFIWEAGAMVCLQLQFH